MEKKESVKRHRKWKKGQGLFRESVLSLSPYLPLSHSVQHTTKETNKQKTDHQKKNPLNLKLAQALYGVNRSACSESLRLLLSPSHVDDMFTQFHASDSTPSFANYQSSRCFRAETDGVEVPPSFTLRFYPGELCSSGNDNAVISLM